MSVENEDQDEVVEAFEEEVRTDFPLLKVFRCLSNLDYGHNNNVDALLDEQYKSWQDKYLAKNKRVEVLDVKLAAAGDHSRTIETMAVTYKLHATS